MIFWCLLSVLGQNHFWKSWGKFLCNFCEILTKTIFRTKSFRVLKICISCPHVDSQFYKKCRFGPLQVPEGLFGSEKVSFVDDTFSAIDFEKSLKIFLRNFSKFFTKFLGQFFESINFEESQKATVKVMLLQLLLIRTPIEIVKNRSKSPKIVKFR